MAWQAQGFRAWLWQRLTAVYIGLYIVVVSIFMIYTSTITYEKWYQWLSHPIINVSLVLFFYAVFFHAWVGIRDVVIDYIKPVSIKLILLIMIALGLFVMALWVSFLLMPVIKL